jgi:UDP-N-acetylmuramate dehydrogenase
MEKSAEGKLEENSGVCEDAQPSEGVGEIVVGTEGHGDVPGSRRYNEDGPGLCEGAEAEISVSGLDLSVLSPRQRARFERELEREQKFTDEAKEDLCRKSFGDCILKDEPMASHTGFGVGGHADALVNVRHLDLLKEVMEFAMEKDIPHLFLGSGSSTLFKDGGFQGLVIKLSGEFKGVVISHEDGGHVYVRAGGATSVEELIEFTKTHGFDSTPLGAPRGTVAGRLMTRPADYAPIVQEVQVVDRTLRELALTRKAFISDNKVRIPRTNAIVSVLLRFTRVAEEAKTSPAEAQAENPSPEEMRLEGIFREVGSQSASEVIADAGLAGIRVGRVRMDGNDPNSFINEGSGSARNAVVLIGLIKDRVREKLGINLESSIRVVGEN